MRAAAFVLILLGGVLPVSAVSWAYVRAQRRLAQLARWDKRTREVYAEAVERGSRGEQGPKENAILAAEGVPTSTWADVGPAQFAIERSALRSAVDAVRGPGLLALSGVVLGMVGGLLALWA